MFQNLCFKIVFHASPAAASSPLSQIFSPPQNQIRNALVKKKTFSHISACMHTMVIVVPVWPFNLLRSALIKWPLTKKFHTPLIYIHRKG